MSTVETTSEYPTSDIQYEVSVSNDAVNLTIRNGAEELSLATDTEGARLLAADILAAVERTRDRGQSEEGEFVFDH